MRVQMDELFHCFFRLLLIVLCMCVNSDSAAGHPLKVPRLLLISFDGFRWDYLSKPDLNIPNFKRVMTDGGRSKYGLKNAFMTKTFPNHYTLVTGLYEESHGIVGNTMFDPVFNETFSIDVQRDVCNPKWYADGGEPIWVTNQRQNLQHRSGAVFWPGSCAEVNGFLPYHYKLNWFDPSVTLDTRIDFLIDCFLDEYPINLGLLYYHEPDFTGHKVGPDSQNISKMIEFLDEELGYLLHRLEQEDLLEQTNIIITSDHGMTLSPNDDEHKINLDTYLDPVKYRCTTVDPVASIWPLRPEYEEEIFRNLSNIPHLHVYRKKDIPEDYHYSDNRRIPPIIAEPDEHYWVSVNNSQTPAGEHGYNNSLPSMHPFFMAMGPSFRSGVSVERLNNVDVYPLMCHLLELEPASNNGSMEVVRELLKSSEEEETSTFVTYICILLFLALVGGVFSVAACRVHRAYKRRRLPLHSLERTIPSTVHYSVVNGDKIPLMSDTSDDDDEFSLPTDREPVTLPVVQATIHS